MNSNHSESVYLFWNTLYHNGCVKASFFQFYNFQTGGGLLSTADTPTVEAVVSWLLEHPSSGNEDSDTDMGSSEDGYSDSESVSDGYDEYEGFDVRLICSWF